MPPWNHIIYYREYPLVSPTRADIRRRRGAADQSEVPDKIGRPWKATGMQLGAHTARSVRALTRNARPGARTATPQAVRQGTPSSMPCGVSVEFARVPSPPSPDHRGRGSRPCCTA